MDFLVERFLLFCDVDHVVKLIYDFQKVNNRSNTFNVGSLDVG